MKGVPFLLKAVRWPVSLINIKVNESSKKGKYENFVGAVSKKFLLG